MKPQGFDYLRATRLADVFAAFAEHGEEAMILAGGQNLVPALNMRLSEPALLVDINEIPDLSGIAVDGDTLRIGALCRHEEVRLSDTVAQHAPLLTRALAHVAHPAIRNRGTIGGSLCNADPAAELPACMLALGASLVLDSAEGRRTVPASEFFLGLYETALTPGEVLTGITLPIAKPGEIQLFDEIARRRGDYALAGLAATAIPGPEGLGTVRFAFLSCADRAVLAPRLAALVEASGTAMPDAADIATALAQDLDPPEDAVTSTAARLHLAGVLARRTLARFHGHAS